MAAVIHWDEVPGREVAQPPFNAVWQDLGTAVGTVATGLRRIEIRPGCRSTPVHVHPAEEEIFYVLRGAGVSWQDGLAYEIGADDCLVHLPGREAHSLLAGPEGLEVLAYSTRAAVEAAHLPRGKVSWLGPTWVTAGEGPHPWARELAAGELEVPAASPRPARIVALADVEGRETSRGEISRVRRNLGKAAGSRSIGMQHVRVAPEALALPPHCHSAEEEVFVVVEGSGWFLLGDQEHEVKRGHVLGCPAGTGFAHSFRAGDTGMAYLAHGQRVPWDTVWYPRSKKISFRGLGVIGRLQPLDYWEGED